ncbi:MAG: hypothetical protein H6R05_641 [Burkholderiaceae bacterium]|nr:hypothetical protein [Burkholderiaceae bacterium]
MTTQNPSSNTPYVPPRVSFTAFPLGAWLVALIGAGIFALTSTHPEKASIAQIIVAASMAVATVAGTLYVLVLLAVKRFPSFKQSFVLGFVLALVSIIGAIGAVVVLNQPKMAFMAIAGFFLLASLAPFFMKKKIPA